MTPTLPLAFFAGVLSFLSPCVLPLVPSYLAYVGGSGAARPVLLRNALLFVLGFSLVFVALGATASLLGSFLHGLRRTLFHAGPFLITPITLVGGLLVIAMGLFMLGAIRLPWLQRDTRPLHRPAVRSPWSGVLLGMAFAAGWSPCIGPMLGAILGLAGVEGTLARGVLLLGAYALGLGLPFVLAALALEPFLAATRRFRAHARLVERIGGGLLVIAGLLVASGTYTVLNRLLIGVTPDWLLSRI